MTALQVASQLGIPAMVATIVTGLFAWMAKKSDHQRPDVLSTGYSSLVNDLQAQVQSLRELVNQLEAKVEGQSDQLRQLRFDRDAQQNQVVSLQLQVDWLWHRLAPEHRALFMQKFGLKGDDMNVRSEGDAS